MCRRLSQGCATYERLVYALTVSITHTVQLEPTEIMPWCITLTLHILLIDKRSHLDTIVYMLKEFISFDE